MREGINEPGQQFLTATDKVWTWGWGHKFQSFVVTTMF